MVYLIALLLKIVLFDPDWNPANDMQALARVWRGLIIISNFDLKMVKRKPVLFTDSLQQDPLKRRYSNVPPINNCITKTGQAHKQSLSSCVVDEEENVERHFSLESLRQLFTFNEKTLCDTHETFKCKRCAHGRQVCKPTDNGNGNVKAGATGNDTSTWNHFSLLDQGKVYDSILKECSLKTGVVTFVFQNKSHDQIVVKNK